jgi:hypothetical protein
LQHNALARRPSNALERSLKAGAWSVSILWRLQLTRQTTTLIAPPSTKMLKHRNLLLALLLALMAGPGPGRAGPKQEDAVRYYEDALTRFQRDDTAGAIVQLKNALQQDPRMLTARVLLGRA